MVDQEPLKVDQGSIRVDQELLCAISRTTTWCFLLLVPTTEEIDTELYGYVEGVVVAVVIVVVVVVAVAVIIVVAVVVVIVVRGGALCDLYVVTIHALPLFESDLQCCSLQCT